jgi:hypothetical protein
MCYWDLSVTLSIGRCEGENEPIGIEPSDDGLGKSDAVLEAGSDGVEVGAAFETALLSGPIAATRMDRAAVMVGKADSSTKGHCTPYRPFSEPSETSKLAPSIRAFS